MKNTTLCSLFVFSAALTIATSFVRADNWSERWTYERDENVDVFPGNQLSLDLFGTYANHDRFGRDRDMGGGGVGLDYFITRYIGISVDSRLEEWKTPYRVDGDLVLRLPLQGKWMGCAPYVLGGGGREFRYVPQYDWNAGLGFEFRFNPYTGLFADARRIFPDTTVDYTVVRAGVRIGF